MKKYSKIGITLGLSIGIIITILLLMLEFGLIPISYKDVLFPVVILYLIPYGLMMLSLDNPSCSLKYSTDCSSEMIISITVSVLVFTVFGYLIGFIVDKIKNSSSSKIN